MLTAAISTSIPFSASFAMPRSESSSYPPRAAPARSSPAPPPHPPPFPSPPALLWPT
eukprot:CAMPEP_0198690572 /NCGR_PEP_ID=MMETSP1468-20131203/179099_1 /TAXON_ID=1461545 /ORGANISM="Mantoniella sp, Strain CCMP1436" /LENGTH=56 /DNA_ID=CAMNT_0044442921 /DNA_START=27 /DNA_END=193 /DNA_ORIENTATION=-